MSTDPISNISPNTPSVSGGKTDAMSQLSGNYSMFLKLLTTQLQNQDPMAPTDATTFTQQLVSYSQVEQQIKTNDNLTSLINATKSGSNSNVALLNYLGRYIAVDGKDFVLQGGKSAMTYQLSSAASKVTLDMIDSTGKTVASYNGAGGTGVQKITWDGTDYTGEALPDGTYTLQVTATDAEGKAVGVKKQSMIGLVTGVAKGVDSNSLFLGNVEIDENKVTNVYSNATDATS